MNQHMRIFTIMMLMVLGWPQAASSDCPIPPTAINPKVDVKTSFDKKASRYTYTYTISNLPNARTSISRFLLIIPADTAVSSVPSHWRAKVFPAAGNRPAYLQISTNLKSIEPRSTFGPVVLRSKLPPGIVKYHIEGDPSEPLKAVTVNNDEESAPSCPGFYTSNEGGSILDEMPVGQTLGPVLSNQVELKLLTKLRRERSIKNEDDESEDLEISAIEKGEMEVVIFQRSI